MNIKCVECSSIEKRNKQQVYVLTVTCDNGNYTIERSYTTFYDFRTKLVELAKDKKESKIPQLLGLKWFEKTLGTGGEKRKRQINEFCKEVLELPTDLYQNVEEFFKPWISDTERVSPDKSSFVERKSEKRRQSSNKHNSTELSLTKDLITEMRNVQKTRTSSSSVCVDENQSNVSVMPRISVSSPDPTSARPPLMKKMSISGSNESLQQYVVMRDYPDNNDKDNTSLRLRDGELVQVHEKNVSGWWFIVKEDTQEQGWAPGAVLQPLDPDQQDADSEDDIDEDDECPVYEAISDYTAKTNDEITYKKSEKLQVLQMRTDGWWKIRSSSGVIGVAPAVSLARVSDGSGPNDPLYSDIQHTQQTLYKKKTPPRRKSSRISLSELYAKVERKPNIPKKPKPSTIREQESSGGPGKQETIGGLEKQESMIEKDKPQVPPKMPGLDRPRRNNYTEIEFTNDETPNKNRKVKKPMNGDPTVYSDVNPGSLPPHAAREDSENDLYLNVDHNAPRQSSYENITEFKKPPSKVAKYFELKEDYNPTLKHKEGMPAEKGDIVKVTKEEGQFAPHLLCVMCLKELVDTKPCEGWVPKKLLMPVNVEVLELDPHGIPVVKVTSYANSTHGEDDSDLYGEVMPSSRPEKNRAIFAKKKDKKGDWFVGQLSRLQCEELLKDAKNLEFVIRESQHGNEDYSISVKYNETIKHFKVAKTTGENKYLIGGHMFKSLSAVVKHYKKHELFYGVDKEPQVLGNVYNHKGKTSN